MSGSHLILRELSLVYGDTLGCNVEQSEAKFCHGCRVMLHKALSSKEP